MAVRVGFVAWGKLAEICGQFLTRGKQAYAEGRFQTRSYNDRDGNEHTVSEVVVSQLRLLCDPKNGNSKTEQATGTTQTSELEINDDDIPF